MARHPSDHHSVLMYGSPRFRGAFSQYVLSIQSYPSGQSSSIVTGPVASVSITRSEVFAPGPQLAYSSKILFDQCNNKSDKLVHGSEKCPKKKKKETEEGLGAVKCTGEGRLDRVRRILTAVNGSVAQHQTDLRSRILSHCGPPSRPHHIAQVRVLIDYPREHAPGPAQVDDLGEIIPLDIGHGRRLDGAVVNDIPRRVVGVAPVGANVACVDDANVAFAEPGVCEAVDFFFFQMVLVSFAPITQFLVSAGGVGGGKEGEAEKTTTITTKKGERKNPRGRTN